MRIAFLLLILIHGLIHILGFVKGFGLKEVKELTLTLSKPIGLVWLSAGILVILYGILQLANTKYAWLFGFIAVAVSQTLIILFWKDAKFGTLPNIAMLLVSLMTYGNYSFNQLTNGETSNILRQGHVSKERVISEADLKELPKPVKNWLRRSGVIGKPYIILGKVTQKAQMKLKPAQKDWYNAEAVQYSTVDVPAFIWTVDVKMNSMINFKGRDKFKDGKGEMLVTLNSLIPIVDEKGDKLSESSLQRYLGEMVWFPSLALSPHITWSEENDSSATATLDYKGTKGNGTFYFNPEGDFIKFSTWRYKGNGPDATKYKWVLLVAEHKIVEGIKIPSKMTATWELEKEDWTWLKLEIMDIRYNERAVP